MATEFSTLWVQMRKEAGFKNAFDFFKKNGGSKVLKLSFISYWKMEQGKLLPKAERLNGLITCLRLHNVRDTHDIAKAYLKTLLGSDQAYRWIEQAVLSKAAGSEEGMARRAVKQYMRESGYQMSVAQTESVFRDYASFWANMALSSSDREWKVSALAKLLGIKTAALRESLRALAAHKLLKILPGGIIRSTMVGKHQVLADFKTLKPGTREKIARYHEEMEKKGKTTHDYYLSFRTTEVDIKNFYPYLDATVNGAGIYEKLGSDPDAAMYVVRARIARLFPLP